MTKKIIAVAIIAALSACSSGGDSDDDPSTEDGSMDIDNGDGDDDGGDDDDDGGDGGDGDDDGNSVPVDTTVTSPGGGEGPVADSPAGSYTGTIGTNAANDGVFVIDNDNNLYGLSISDDGSAESYFGTLEEGDEAVFTGDVQLYAHQESQPEGFNGGFGSVAAPAVELEAVVNIVNGQTVEQTSDSSISVSLVSSDGGSVTPATEAALEGTWAGIHGFCGGDECFELATELSFDGQEVTGFTTFDDNPNVPISGLITEFGDAALINYSWGTEGLYSGIVFFNPNGDGTMVFVGEIVNGGDTAVTISGLMTAQ